MSTAAKHASQARWAAANARLHLTHIQQALDVGQVPDLRSARAAVELLQHLSALHTRPPSPKIRETAAVIHVVDVVDPVSGDVIETRFPRS